jgi:hypothetical protein
MSASSQPKSNRERVAAHRDRLRKQGLRPVQIWIPDVNSPEFKEEARRQSLLIAQSPQEQDDLAFVDSLIDWEDE